MKTYAFLMLLLVFALNSTHAQKVHFHLNTGAIFSQVDGDSYGGYKKLGYNFGAGFRFDSGKKGFLDWTNRMNQKGYREVNGLVYDKVKLDYFESELLYGVQIKDKINLGTGLYYGYLLNETRSLRRGDVAPTFRFSYKVVEALSVSTRFAWSVRSIRENGYSYWLNRTLLLEFILDL